MLTFGPMSSVFDFMTFGVMLGVFHAGPDQFRSGWFVESLATQTLVIFAIRTRRVPFFRSHPSLPLTLAAFGVVTVGVLLPATPLAAALGFAPLPLDYFAALAGMVVGYLVLIEIGKRIFYGAIVNAIPPAPAELQPGASPAPPGRTVQHEPLTGPFTVVRSGSEAAARPARDARPGRSAATGTVLKIVVVHAPRRPGRGPVQHRVADRSEEQPGELTATARADDDELRPRGLLEQRPLPGGRG